MGVYGWAWVGMGVKKREDRRKKTRRKSMEY